MAAAARKLEPEEMPPRAIIAVAPLTMTRAEALAYTGIAQKRFEELEAAGQITGRPCGRNGATIFLRAQLDDVVGRIFRGGASNIDDEFGIDG